MNKITQQYQNEIEKYDSFCSKVESLIKELLTSNNVKYHKIEARAKSVESLDKKILSKNNKYDNIGDITDIIGIRIITYFEDEVDIVAKVIEEEFEIDKDNSCDKRILDNNTFGYRSLHYVAQLNTDRKELIEYKRFSNIKFEVQIRSILQHAWAEIEHDLGYKGLNTVPDSFKRNFSMIAALLEMADRDFITLREESKGYKDNVDLFIKETPENVDINIDSLLHYIYSSSVIKKIDEELVQNIITATLEDSVGKDVIIGYIEELNYFGINSINKLEVLLLDNKKNISRFAKKWIKPSIISTTLPKGICIFYLCYVLIGCKNLDDIEKYICSMNIDGNNFNSLSQEIKETYNTIKEEQ